MTTKKTVAGALPEIAVLRQQVADSQASAYGALIGYSGFLNKQWSDDWFNLEYVDLRDGTSDLAKLALEPAQLSLDANPENDHRKQNQHCK